jgi:hypothetical protein
MNAALTVQPSWTLAHPPHDLTSSTTSTLLRNLRLFKEATYNGLHATRRGSADTTWDIWHEFYELLHCDPYLETINDPIPLLQIFAHRYRTGTLAPSGANVRSRTVEGALRAVGQMLATLGCQDPPLQSSGKLDSHPIKRQTHHRPESSQYLSPSSHTLPTFPTYTIQRKDTPSPIC